MDLPDRREIVILGETVTRTSDEFRIGQGDAVRTTFPRLSHPDSDDHPHDKEAHPAMAVTHDEALEFMSGLDKGSNLFGALSPEVRARLFAVVDKPSQETWDDAHLIILTSDRMTTLWQALLAHTDYDLTSGPSHTAGQTPGPWPQLPTSEQLLIAIRTELNGA